MSIAAVAVVSPLYVMKDAVGLRRFSGGGHEKHHTITTTEKGSADLQGG
jgi:acid phosphatase family membrane protein YuiD